MHWASRLSVLVTLWVMCCSAQADAAIAVHVPPAAPHPTFLGLVDLSKPPEHEARILHVRVGNAPALEPLAAGDYRLDHVDYSPTIAGDERTVRLGNGPSFHLEEGSVTYPGDLYFAGGELLFIVNWNTVDTFCGSSSMAGRQLDIATPGAAALPGAAAGTIRDACDGVNIRN